MKHLRSVLMSVVMLPLAGVVAIPFYYILVNTLKTQPEISASPLGLPSVVDFSNYAEVFETLPIWQSFLNTLHVGVVSIFLMLLVGSMAAYGMLIGQDLLTKLIGVICLVKD